MALRGTTLVPAGYDPGRPSRGDNGLTREDLAPGGGRFAPLAAFQPSGSEATFGRLLRAWGTFQLAEFPSLEAVAALLLLVLAYT